MPRKRSKVNEDAVELIRLESTLRGERKLAAIKMLRLLEEEPDRTLSEAAVLMNRPERTIRRWWQVYLNGGLEALLRDTNAGGQRPRPLSKEVATAFRSRAYQGFPDLKEAQLWLVQEYGVKYSLARVSELLRDADGIPSPQIENGLSNISTPQCSLIDHNLISILNSLPTTTHPFEWAKKFSQLLSSLLSDVDRISININTGVSFYQCPAKRLNLRCIQHLSVDEGSEGMFTCVPYDETAAPSTQLIHDFKEAGWPVHLYRSPVAFDYFTDLGDYAGSLIVWRDRDKAPTSPTTLRLFEQLRPFLVFALTDAAARVQCSYPSHTGFLTALTTLRKENNLTPQEYRIVSLRFLGYSYKDIADMLCISITTVKKHLNTVHQKSGTRSQYELFARYVSVREWA